jgi:hypothetical protein
MHIADSLRQKASSKIAAGGITDARDNAGGFSAAVRMKSNQHMLQSKRINIQNSLSFLQAQRDAINESRDTMERIGLLKIKFDDPTLNESDKSNINNEFKELALKLYNLRQQKFNGQPLFAESEKSNPDQFGGKRTGLPAGGGLDGQDAKITLQGLDFEDIDSIYKAGEAVRRGLGGLDYVNFGIDDVQQQQEYIDIYGGIAEGDTFSFYINQKTQIGETLNTNDNNIDIDGDGNDSGSPHLISYTATLADENDADPHAAVAAGLQALVDDLMGVDLENQPAEFVVTENDIQSISKDFGTSGIPDIKNGARLIIKSKQSGVPFEVFNASSTGSTGKITITETSGRGGPTDPPAFVANDAEEKTLALDLKDDDGLNSGYVLQGDDSVSITVDGQNVSYKPSQADINGAVIDLSDPLNYKDAALFMLNGLMSVINNQADTNPSFKVRATNASIDGDVAEITIKSTHRGDPLTGLTPGTIPTVSFNLAGNEQAATGSTVKITKSERDAEDNDTIRIIRTASNGSQQTLNLTRDENAQATDLNKFKDFEDLALKINQDARFTTQINPSKDEITITDALPETIDGIRNPDDTDGSDGFDRAQGVTLTVRQGQDHAAEDSGSVISISANETLFAAKASSFTNRTTTKTGGLGDNALTVDFDINPTDGAVTASTLSVNNGGAGYAIGDQFTVAGTELGDTDGNSITFNVDSVAGKAATASSVGTQTGKVASDNYTNTGIATTGGGNNDFALNITSQDNGTITKAQTSISAGGTGYSFGNTLSISAANLGGGNAVAGQITVTEVDNGTFGGPGVITNYTWDSGSARSDNLATTYNAVTTTKVGGGAGDNNLTLNITTNASGTITGATVNAPGLGYAIGDTVEVTAAALGTSGANRTFTVSGINGEVTGFSHDSGRAQSNWTMTGTENTLTGNNLQITVSAGRDGVMTVDSIDNNGSGYSEGATNSINLVAAAGGHPDVSKNFNISDVKKQFTLAETQNLGTAGTGITTTNAERGDQFIAEGGNSAVPQASDDASFSEVTADAIANVVGENRVRTVSINADKKLNGTGNDSDRIHVGDVFSITVKEGLHPDEDSGAWPESNAGANTHGEGDRTGSEYEITATYTAVANDTEETVAANLLLAFGTQRTALTSLNPLADDDLPTGVVSGNTITFTSNRPGENFEVSWNRADNPDIIEATGAVNDPSGSASAVPNVSPFSIQKSLTYFMDMLSQNAAETSRLMKAQEHLENTIVSTEQAWGKMTDTDYAQASTEQVRASMKMEMANSIIGKSIRMNDLLVDLTTKHYRGAILNARA